MEKLTRKQFLKGAAAGAAGIAAMSTLGASVAFASDLQDEECSWVGEEAAINEADIKETIEAEVLVVGAGTGGMFTGAFLADKGLKPLLIEKNAMLSFVKGDLGAFNSRFVEEHGDLMDPAHVFHQLVDYSAGRADTRLIKLWMSESGPAIEALDDMLKKYDLGYVYHDGGYAQMNGWEGPLAVGAYTKNPTGHHVRATAEGVFGSGALLQQILEANGGELRMETAMVKLEYDGRRVTGVIATNELGDYIRINAAKGVILATGGYQGSEEIFNKLQPDTALFMPPVIPGGCTGDGHKACLWLGACVDEIHTSMLFERRLLLPGESAPEVSSDRKTSNLGSQPFLKLDCNGNRFTNESQPYDYILHTIANLPQHAFCEIFDADFAKYIVQFETVGCSRFHAYPSACEDYAAQKDELIEAVHTRVSNSFESLIEGGYLQTADTIEELAEKMGLPVENVVNSINRYNELYDKGIDEDFYKEPYRLSPVRNPPFYGMRFCGSMLCTMDGVRIDTYMRPVDKEGQPFENVFAIGDCSGGLFTHTYPNLFTGIAAGRTMTWAWRVANILSGELPVE